ncbi:MAG: hypothetical protein ABFC86_06110 [Rectinema sp.]
MYLRKDRMIYLIAGITYMRKQINDLAAITQAKQPYTGFSGSFLYSSGERERS